MLKTIENLKLGVSKMEYAVVDGVVMSVEEAKEYDKE